MMNTELSNVGTLFIDMRFIEICTGPITQVISVQRIGRIDDFFRMSLNEIRDCLENEIYSLEFRARCMCLCIVVITYVRS